MPGHLKAFSVLGLVSVVTLLPLPGWAASHDNPAVTPAPNGPYRIIGSRILDRQNQPYLIRGTQLAPLTQSEADEKGSRAAFGPLSATTLITIRQRLNMNAVRLPVNAPEYNSNPDYRSRVERLVRLANTLELLVILGTRGVPRGTGSDDLDLFWKFAASRFRDNPNIFFAPLAVRFVAAIRQAGARQPVIVAAQENAHIEDRNIIYEVTPHYASKHTEPGLRRQLGSA